MNIKEIFADHYTEEQLIALQDQQDRLALEPYDAEHEIRIDPIERMVFPSRLNQDRVWMIKRHGFDAFLAANMQKLLESDLKIYFAINDTAGEFTAVSGLRKYERIEWSGDNTGTGPEDRGKHGHNVASGIVDLLRPLFDAGKAQLIANKVMDGSSGSFSWIGRGIYRLTDLPLGENELLIQVNSYGANGVKEFKFVDDAIAEALGKGHLFLASSGNSGTDPSGASRFGYPAVKDNVLAIGASDQNDRIMSYSSTGPEVFAVHGSGFVCVNPDGTFGVKHGTSFSQPFACAVVALGVWFYDTKFTQDQAGYFLDEKAIDLGVEGRDVLFGHGIVKGTSITGEFDAPDNPDEPGDQPGDEPDEPQEPGLTTSINYQLDGARMRYKIEGQREYRRMTLDNMMIAVTGAGNADRVYDTNSTWDRDYFNRTVLVVPNSAEWGHDLTAYWSGQFYEYASRNQGIGAQLSYLKGTDEDGRNSIQTKFDRAGITSFEHKNGWIVMRADTEKGEVRCSYRKPRRKRA